MKRVYPNGGLVIIPQFDHFARFMNKYGMKRILRDPSIGDDLIGSLHGYIEAIFELTREFIYDVDGSVVPHEKIYEALDLCQFFKLFDSVGTSFSESAMKELVALTKLFITYIMIFLNSNNLVSLLEDDMIVHEVNDTNIVLEVDKLSYGFN